MTRKKIRWKYLALCIISFSLYLAEFEFVKINYGDAAIDVYLNDPRFFAGGVIPIMAGIGFFFAFFWQFRFTSFRQK